MSQDKQKTVLIYVAAGAALFIIYKILQGIGFIGDKTDNQAAQLDEIKEFDPKQAEVITKDLSKRGYTSKTALPKFVPNDKNLSRWAKEIFEADGITDDDEDIVYANFRSLKNRYELALLSLIFAKNHKKDLREYLKKFLDTSELATIFTIVSPLKRP